MRVSRWQIVQSPEADSDLNLIPCCLDSAVLEIHLPRAATISPSVNLWCTFGQCKFLTIITHRPRFLHLLFGVRYWSLIGEIFVAFAETSQPLKGKVIIFKVILRPIKHDTVGDMWIICAETHRRYMFCTAAELLHNINAPCKCTSQSLLHVKQCSHNVR